MTLDTAVELVDGDEGSLLAHNAAAADLCFVMTVRNPDSEQTLLGQRVPLGQGITGLAAESGSVQVGAPIFKDIHQSERLRAGPEAVVAAPMLVGEELLGVITAVSFTAGRRFGAREAEIFARFAAITGALIEATRTQPHADGSRPLAYGASSEREEAALQRLARIARRDAKALSAIERLVDAAEQLSGTKRS